MNLEIPEEDVEIFEQQQLARYAELGIEPTDYTDRGGKLFLTSDLDGMLAALDGTDADPLPGSRYDPPECRRKLSRIGLEFLQACSARHTVETPVFGTWPERIPGGLYAELPSGRPLLLFTGGAFTYFDRFFTLLAAACPIDSDGFDTERGDIPRLEDWGELPSVSAAVAPFRELILDLVLSDDSRGLREELGLRTKDTRPTPIVLPKTVDWHSLDKGFCARMFDDQCFRFLLGHEFGHVLVDRGELEYVDQIPSLMFMISGKMRVDYNTEITCDSIGVEFALKYAKAIGILPEFAFAGVYLFFHLWHLTCRAVWTLQWEHVPEGNDIIYPRHPPTLIRCTYAYNLMKMTYDQEGAERALLFTVGLKSVLDSLWQGVKPSIDELRARGIDDQIDREVLVNLNPGFSARLRHR
jgi:hypothetical protein